MTRRRVLSATTKGADFNKQFIGQDTSLDYSPVGPMKLNLTHELSVERRVGWACRPIQSVLFGFWNHLALQIGASFSSPVPTGLFERYTDLPRQLAPEFRILMNNPG
jgi:hypothetical protein